MRGEETTEGFETFRQALGIIEAIYAEREFAAFKAAAQSLAGGAAHGICRLFRHALGVDADGKRRAAENVPVAHRRTAVAFDRGPAFLAQVVVQRTQVVPRLQSDQVVRAEGRKQVLVAG